MNCKSKLNNIYENNESMVLPATLECLNTDKNDLLIR